MKFSLLFLIGCMVTTTFGQNLFYWPLPHFGQHPPAASNGRSSGQYWPRNYHQESYESDIDDVADQEDEVLARNKLRGGLIGSKRKSVNKFQQVKFNDYARFLSTRPTSTSTSTSIATTYGTTTTITQTSTKSCFPSNMLSANAPACRRKRDIPLILEQIEPTPNINQVETTLFVDTMLEDRIRRDVESSQDLVLDLAERQGASPRFGFNILSSILFAPAPTTTTTITTTITIPTTYVVISTFTVKTLPLADPGKLLCSPASYSTC